jgi:predicted ATP-dependent endonuclease of OLD family
MRIDHIHIRNFRKLKNCRIDFNKDQTIFVGANNSGKTSAMSAIIWFLKDQNRFTTREFTLTNWRDINELANSWLAVNDEMENREELLASLLSPEQWDNHVPSLDLWINVDEREAYMVYKLIPSLEWKKDLVGVRLRFEPKDIKKLYADFRTASLKVKEIKESPQYKDANNVDLFPQNMWDFLNRRGNLNKYFEIKYYVLDSQNIDYENPDCNVQATPSISLENNPLVSLIKIDSIEAFREFSDPEGRNDNDIDTLSRQLQSYYKSNFEDETQIDLDDLKLLGEMKRATETYDEKLDRSFKAPIAELNNINYPGFQNPEIHVKSHVNIVDSITHESSVQFTVQGDAELSLPEKYNGLGLRNLISIYLKMVQFREQWTNLYRIDKAGINHIEPIHLVFIEEPEAHLHAQAQQVFIRKAMDALTNDSTNEILRNNKDLTTQLVVSTHSNHIVNEVDMCHLRYFKRIIDDNIKIPVSEVVNLSRTFGDDNDTKRFVTRYIRLTHCDIFFADAIILVEGAAERILMPKFIRDENMDNFYISVIEINGSHAHRFDSLTQKLGIPTLIITDIDAQEGRLEKGELKWKSAIPQKNKKQITNNDTIKHWLKIESIDMLLELPFPNKQRGNICISYQTPISVNWTDQKKEDELYEVHPYTFEDSLVFTNIKLFQSDEKMAKMGVITTFYNYLKKAISLEDFHEKMFSCLEKRKNVKASFATDILCTEQFDKIQAPSYIKEGLIWLQKCLNNKIRK